MILKLRLSWIWRYCDNIIFQARCLRTSVLGLSLLVAILSSAVRWPLAALVQCRHSFRTAVSRRRFFGLTRPWCSILAITTRRDLAERHRKHTIPDCGAWWRQHHAAGPGRLEKVEGEMNAAKYREILEDNLIQCARDMWLGRRFIFQQDVDPKHTDKGTQKWFKVDEVNVAERPSQSSDLNPT